VPEVVFLLVVGFVGLVIGIPNQGTWQQHWPGSPRRSSASTAAWMPFPIDQDTLSGGGVNAGSRSQA